MLKGEAKTAYMREYMRRRRAGLATAKPKPPWRPPQRMIAQIRHWGAILSWRMRQPAHVIIDGLRLDTDDGVLEACRRYKRYLDDRGETKRREAEEREAAKRAPPECSFCFKPASRKRIVLAIGGTDYPRICGTCVAKAARIIARRSRCRI